MTTASQHPNSFGPAVGDPGPARSSALLSGLVRAAAVLVVGGLGILVWRALILAGVPAGRGAVPPGYSAVANMPAQQMVNTRLGASLTVLALALVAGALIGFATAGLRVALASANTDLGRAAGGVGWLLSLLWTPPAPVAMAIALLAVTGTAGLVGAGRTATLTLVLGSAVAVLVAVAVGERWRRRAWLAGGLAGVGAAGQGLAVITGALLVGEPLVSQPGVGDLLIRSLTTHDGNVVAAAATTLLIFALVGQLVGALAGTFSDRLDAPASPAEPERSGVLTTFRVAAAATLILPLLALAGSLLAGSTTNFDLEHVSMGPSLIHLLGTDSFGRDLLARLLISFRSAWLVTLGGLLLAAVLGLIWAGLAVLLERKWPRGGRLVAEVLLAPGRLMMVAPLLLAAVVLVGADRWPAVLAFAVILTPRLAAAIVSLARPFPASVPSAIRATGGLLLTAWGIALIVLVGQQFVGVGVTPPAPALGGLLSERVQYLVIGAGQALLVALATILLTAPFLLAGWALLRQPPRADVLTTLDT